LPYIKDRFLLGESLFGLGLQTDSPTGIGNGGNGRLRRPGIRENDHKTVAKKVWGSGKSDEEVAWSKGVECLLAGG
jgi:hypothetical protein